MKKRWIAALFLFVLALWFGCYFLLSGAVWEGVPYAMNEDYLRYGDRGTFGDMFGALNALFSGLAFAGLICTLIIQKKELEAQREELGLANQEMGRQYEVMKKQLTQIDIQNFESGFFQVYKMHGDIIDRLKTYKTGSASVIEGRSVFSCFVRKVKIEFEDAPNRPNQEEIEPDVLLSAIAREFNEKCVGDYIRSLLALFSYIDSSGLDAQQKQRYINLVISYMDGEEYKFILIGYLATENEFLANVIRNNDLFNQVPASAWPMNAVPDLFDYGLN